MCIDRKSENGNMIVPSGVHRARYQVYHLCLKTKLQSIGPRLYQHHPQRLQTQLNHSLGPAILILGLVIPQVGAEFRPYLNDHSVGMNFACAVLNMKFNGMCPLG